MRRRAVIYLGVALGAALIAAAPGCVIVVSQIRGSGRLTTTDREVGRFTRVRLEGPLDGGRTRLEITGSGDLTWTGHTTFEDVSIPGSSSIVHRARFQGPPP